MAAVPGFLSAIASIFYKQHASMLRQKGKRDAAISAYPAAIAIVPKEVMVDRDLAEILAQMDKDEEEIATYGQIAEMKPNSACTFPLRHTLALGSTLALFPSFIMNDEEHNKPASAIAAYRKAIEHPPDEWQGVAGYALAHHIAPATQQLERWGIR